MRAAAPRWKAAFMHPAAKPLLFVLCLLPFAQLLYGAVFDTLGANPAEALLRATGDWTLRFLCVALAVTPARVLLGLPALARFRRMLGLYVFFYALLHLLCYSVFDQGLDLAEIWRDTLERPFILVGMLAFVLLTALAATSPHRMTRLLGARRWQRLHRSVYAVAGLALLHFFWMRAGKNNFAEVLVYTAIIALLLGWRAQRAIRKRRAAA
ncbi:sulfite oxidase heme-binding subunit YedZ [Comamonas antarctica]|uniref:Protein-methionine-sulfoxide reductase heme-binding subunit MsrQ n=1 Tax=Comamonas antarctica TaxID=2743470 RepID=A0A6N1XAI8_9BURK|nr:protein-methionine-sulfoxide reductase heme-binding subunit MsrQ [Comamonas antarctica]QKV55082.1 sulfoxide reductase heme-binding subunit YedZ [Comamonas antarctica]